MPGLAGNQDLLILEAKRKDSKELTSLMERWRAQIKTDQLQIMPLDKDVLEIFYPVEKEPFFNNLRNHLEGAMIWQYLDDFKKSYQQTCKFALTILAKLQEETQGKTGLRTSTETEVTALVPEFSFSVFYASIIRPFELAAPLHMAIVRHFPKFSTFQTGEYEIQEVRKGLWELRLGNMTLARGLKENMQSCRSIHQEMVVNLINSKEFTEYVASSLVSGNVKNTLEAEVERLISLNLSYSPSDCLP
jgi:hypothetical protein